MRTKSTTGGRKSIGRLEYNGYGELFVQFPNGEEISMDTVCDELELKGLSRDEIEELMDEAYGSGEKNEYALTYDAMLRGAAKRSGVSKFFDTDSKEYATLQDLIDAAVWNLD